MTTSEPLSNGGEALFDLDSTDSQAASPARTSRRAAEPASGSADRSRVCGARSPTPFATYDPASSWWRMSQHSMFEDSTSSSLTLPRSGSMRNGTLFRLPPSVLPISEIAYSYWPTPVASDTGHRLTPYSQGGRALSFMAGGRLNPTWVEWLMGFPEGWTDGVNVA